QTAGFDMTVALGTRVAQQVIQKAEALHRRIDEFEIRAACAATRQAPLYASEAAVPFDVIVSASAANMRAMFSAIAAKSEFDPTPGTKVGIERARDGVPLASVMEAYRVGFHALWDEVVDVPAIRAPGNGARCAH